jgi:fluoroquinolone resistance protein
MSTKDLIARWKSTLENDRASERIFNICKYGGVLSMDQTPFGRLEGDLIDFRGYPAHRILVKDVTLKDIDFSYADFSSSWMETNRFENCLFVKTDFTDAPDHGNAFDHCTFHQSKFKLAVLGYKGSHYRNCIFRECGFQRTNFIRPEFVNTDFINCRLKSIDFNASSFENCKFEGLLEDVWFRGTFPSASQIERFGQPKINKMENVSFENADLHYPAFSNWCDLSTVKIKNDGKHFKYDNWYQRLQFLGKEIESWDDEHQRNRAAKFVKVYSVHAPTQEWNIVNLNDLQKPYGTDVASKIIDILDAYISH